MSKKINSDEVVVKTDEIKNYSTKIFIDGVEVPPTDVEKNTLDKLIIVKNTALENDENIKPIGKTLISTVNRLYGNLEEIISFKDKDSKVGSILYPRIELLKYINDLLFGDHNVIDLYSYKLNYRGNELTIIKDEFSTVSLDTKSRMPSKSSLNRISHSYHNVILVIDSIVHLCDVIGVSIINKSEFIAKRVSNSFINNYNSVGVERAKRDKKVNLPDNKFTVRSVDGSWLEDLKTWSNGEIINSLIVKSQITTSVLVDDNHPNIGFSKIDKANIFNCYLSCKKLIQVVKSTISNKSIKLVDSIRFNSVNCFPYDKLPDDPIIIRGGHNADSSIDVNISSSVYMGVYRVGNLTLNFVYGTIDGESGLIIHLPSRNDYKYLVSGDNFYWNGKERRSKFITLRTPDDEITEYIIKRIGLKEDEMNSFNTSIIQSFIKFIKDRIDIINRKKFMSKIGL